MQIVLMDFSHEWGTSQRHLVDLALLLHAEERFEVLVCCPARSPVALRATARALPLLALYPPYRDRWWNPLHYLRLWLLTRQNRYCIFHTFSDDAARLALRIAQKRQPGRTVLIHNCHNMHSLATRDAQGEMPTWWQQIHMILCGNSYARKQLLAAGLDAMRVIRLPAGVDISELPPRQSVPPCEIAPAGQDVQRGHDLPAERCIIVSMSSRTESASHSVLIKTMAALWQSESIPPWEVRIVGQCDNFAALMDEAHALGVQSRLSLLQAQPLPKVLPLGHIMVSPSTSVHGSLPVMAAAWATGLPLICPELPTNTEWAKQGTNALLYKAEDPQDLAACLKNLMTDTVLYRGLVEGGLLAAPRTTRDATLAQVRDLYTQCMQKNGWVLPPKIAPKPPKDDAVTADLAAPTTDVLADHMPANAAPADTAQSPTKAASQAPQRDLA